MERALGHLIVREVIAELREHGATVRQVGAVVLEGSEAGDDLAVESESRHPVGDRLLRVGNDACDGFSKRLQSAALGLVHLRQIVVDVSGRHTVILNHRVVDAQPRRRRGSLRSRKPSPSRLKPSTVTMIASPGRVARCGESRMYDKPKASVAPQLGVGGGTPRPRKLSAASVVIAVPMPSVASTSSGAAALGRMCPSTIRGPVSPITRAASTNSSCLSASALARTTRAKTVHCTRPTARITLPMPTSMIDTSASASSSGGNACTISTPRMMSRSLHPPTYPDTSPMDTPMSTATAMDASPTMSDTRAPNTSRVSKSRP